MNCLSQLIFQRNQTWFAHKKINDMICVLLPYSNSLTTHKMPSISITCRPSTLRHIWNEMSSVSSLYFTWRIYGICCGQFMALSTCKTVCIINWVEGNHFFCSLRFWLNAVFNYCDAEEGEKDREWISRRYWRLVDRENERVQFMYNTCRTQSRKLSINLLLNYLPWIYWGGKTLLVIHFSKRASCHAWKGYYDCLTSERLFLSVGYKVIIK